MGCLMIRVCVVMALLLVSPTTASASAPDSSGSSANSRTASASLPHELLIDPNFRRLQEDNPPPGRAPGPADDNCC
ncbi:hypothetical protein GOP47_0029943 [Adiantum capillus-veneris]|nr:hypothetical protein GOP47_0029943 [Adiantum capillus-veneris]